MKCFEGEQKERKKERKKERQEEQIGKNKENITPL